MEVRLYEARLRWPSMPDPTSDTADPEHLALRLCEVAGINYTRALAEIESIREDVLCRLKNAA